MAATTDFAILAPVPLEYLVSGEGIAEKEGFVAFGSRKWELFRQVEKLRNGAPVPVLIYPSHEYVPVRNSLLMYEALLAAYGRFVDSLGGRYITAADVGTFASDLDVVGPPEVRERLADLGAELVRRYAAERHDSATSVTMSDPRPMPTE